MERIKYMFLKEQIVFRGARNWAAVGLNQYNKLVICKLADVEICHLSRS